MQMDSSTNKSENEITPKNDNLDSNNSSIPRETFETWTLISDNSQSFILNDLTDNVGILNFSELRDNIDDISDGISIISENESAGRNSPFQGSLSTIYVPNINQITQETQYEPTTPPTTPNKIVEFLYNDDIKNIPTEQSEKTESEVTKTPIKKCKKCNKKSMKLKKRKENDATEEFYRRHLLVIIYIIAIIIGISCVGKFSYLNHEKTKEEKLLQRLTNMENDCKYLHNQVNNLNKKIHLLIKQNKLNLINQKEYDKEKLHIKPTPIIPKNINDGDNTKPNSKDSIFVWAGNGKIQRIQVPRKALKIPYSLCNNPNLHNTNDDLCYNNNGKLNDDPIDDDLIKPHLYNENDHFEAEKSINFDNMHDDSIIKLMSSPLTLNMKTADIFNSQNNIDNDSVIVDNVNLKLPKHKNCPQTEKERKNFLNFEHNRKIEEHGDDDECKSEEIDLPSPSPVANTELPTEQKNGNNQGKENYAGNDNVNIFNQKYARRNKKMKNMKKYPEKNVIQDQDGDEDWHENLMKSREENRKKNYERNNKNWYIDLGNGREEARIFGKEFRYKKMKKR